ncbi:MAG: glycosyl transferase group 1 [Sphingobacterium sp.]|jgi:glycosyltransferase involved in cell wall biosynthesis|nr:glycosyl transferase group 1 [Sphingobacterium sp.]
MAHKPRVLTWHIHGSYLYYLSLGDYILYVPYTPEHGPRYVGRGNTFPFGENVIEVPASEVRNLELDLILFQCDENYLQDQYDILSSEQRQLPGIYIEHDPPWQHPCDEVHPVTNPAVTLVHVTHFNQLMWKTDLPDVRVITHGVEVHGVKYTGLLDRGIVVVNNLPSRGRMLGSDLFERVQKQVPLDLIGMGNEPWGIGEVLHPELSEFIKDYRFFFNPIRYTSLGLAICEAMMVGLPIVGLATTELSTIIENGKTGYIGLDIDILVEKMKMLLDNPKHAQHLGEQAAQKAADLFDIQRFAQQWTYLIHQKIN